MSLDGAEGLTGGVRIGSRGDGDNVKLGGITDFNESSFPGLGDFWCLGECLVGEKPAWDGSGPPPFCVAR